MSAFFEDIKRYVRFEASDEACLGELGGRLEPTFDGIIAEFYGRLSEHPEAVAVLSGGQEQQRRLERSLKQWLQAFFAGPWDDRYFEQRARIGRRHVEVGLPQRYMLTAMALIRLRLCEEARRLPGGQEQHIAWCAAISKLCDLELAIMLHTYREDSRRRLQASERLATFGALTSAICHELRNPLGVVESSTFILRRRVDDDRAVEHLVRIQRQVKRAMRIISSMLELVRETPVSVRPTSAGQLVKRACAHVHEERGTHVETRLPEQPLRLVADPDLTLQILANLLGNAFDAAGPDGQVRIAVSARTDGEAPMVRFVVSDSGPGIDPGIRARLFEPLVTTKATGIGLGLALSRKLAEQQKGRLTLVGGDLAGAGFALDLPAHPA